ncbi:putative enzyme related to lactoylglutathione lyase [Humibacillus xanthopallidus]|uniref:Putative enzyme related to lactoylglutathione lyase n=1 Tax=Humibacillus xanthopallidus TaxID=412689 RepID=A0A543PPF5_9MICO|nr:VOC family protein [Humibacillus xanthopallidus]TQN45953.1 putative enzyme related to lactoylglutathione lyase [Humibacillus xanthopallidus]
MNDHPVVMFEFISERPDELRAFYRAAFGWDYESSGGFAYVTFGSPPPTSLGGIGQAQVGVPGWEPGARFYLATDDLEATLASVVEAGGARYVEPQRADAYEFAMFTDPDGNIVGLLKSSASH